MQWHNRFSVLALPFLVGAAMVPRTVAAEMSSTNYEINASVTDSTGQEKSSPGYHLLDAVGQATPTGLSGSNSSLLHAGFIYQTDFTLSVENAAANTIAGLTAILNDPTNNLTKQEAKSINLAIQFLQDAIDAFALYTSGDPTALANALNKTKSAINKLLAVSIDTTVYQKMLAQAAELGVSTEINRIETLAGTSDPSVIQARTFLSEGSAELLNADYNLSVQSFVQAFNEALLAV